MGKAPAAPKVLAPARSISGCRSAGRGDAAVARVPGKLCGMADRTSQPGPAGSPAEPPSPDERTDTGEKIETLDPQRLLRIAGVTREVLDEARRIRPEAGAVDHLRRLHDQIYHELREALPSELYAELDDLTP